MTPREPDRFAERATNASDRCVREGHHDRDTACVNCIAAALRREHAAALDEAAQLFEDDAKQSDANANGAWDHGESDGVVDHFRREARICRSDAARIRALASPAAAPAAVTIRTVPMMPVDEEADARIDALRAAQPSGPAAPASPDPCQRCGKLGGRVISFSFDGISTSRWICPHCLDTQDKRLWELEKLNYAGVRVLVEPCEIGGHYRNDNGVTFHPSPCAVKGGAGEGTT